MLGPSVRSFKVKTQQGDIYNKIELPIEQHRLHGQSYRPVARTPRQGCRSSFCWPLPGRL